jgi:hypothetical protein
MFINLVVQAQPHERGFASSLHKLSLGTCQVICAPAEAVQLNTTDKTKE